MAGERGKPKAQTTKKATNRKEPAEKVQTNLDKFNLVCSYIEEEAVSMRKACAVLGIPRTLMFKMIEENEERRNQYARACEERADIIFEEILEIADESSQDSITVNPKGGGASYEILNKEFVERSKVKIDARKWVLGKMQPKKFGDKIDLDLNTEKVTIVLNLGGSEGENED